jgi:hypothetical protein
MRLQFYEERWNLIVKRGSQNKSGDRLTPRPERKESQLFEEIL